MNNKNSFNHNNWLKNSDKLGLNILNSRGISIYLDKKGYINYRLSRNEPYISTKDYKSFFRDNRAKYRRFESTKTNRHANRSIQT